jgi:hypothetical protein
MSEMQTEQAAGTRVPRGWPVIKQIFADFLLVFFGSWLLARATADWIRSANAFDEVSGLALAWMVIETLMAVVIVALGVDLWRTHSRESRVAEEKHAPEAAPDGDCAMTSV